MERGGGARAEQGHINAFRNYDDWKRYGSLLRSDREAANRFGRSLDRGDVTSFDPGDEVFIEHRKGPDVCLRPRGNYTCFWTYREIVKR